nr:endogenous retrovirus group K member 113 Gag polyprotein-like [Vicugna pacos]
MTKFKDIIAECVRQNISKENHKALPQISSPPPEYILPIQEEGTHKPVVLSPLQKALQQATKEGEHIPGFSLVYPVLEDAQQQRYYESIPFKQLKELKMACAQYGPTAHFTQAIIESLGNQYLPPNDWKQVARACLSGGKFLLWKSEFYENCAATDNINQRQGIQITLEQLTGEGQYHDTNSQLGYLPGAYPQINAAALKAWRRLPNSEHKTEDLSKIRQGPDEPYQDFVARLMETIGKVIGDEQAGMVLAKQLAYENANSACQAALRPDRKKSHLADFIRICADIGPSYVQGIALAAALQGKTVKEVLFQQNRPKRNFQGTSRVAGPPGSCYACGQLGHRANQCPKRGQQPTGQDTLVTSPGLCPKCKKGQHWAKDCRSKTDINGQLLTQGNWVRGQLQAQKQCYGAIQATSQISHNPFLPGQIFQTSTEQPQEAQDWTSVPPPTQY